MAKQAHCYCCCRHLLTVGVLSDSSLLGVVKVGMFWKHWTPLVVVIVIGLRCLSLQHVGWLLPQRWIARGVVVSVVFVGLAASPCIVVVGFLVDG